MPKHVIRRRSRSSKEAKFSQQADGQVDHGEVNVGPEQDEGRNVEGTSGRLTFFFGWRLDGTAPRWETGHIQQQYWNPLRYSNCYLKSKVQTPHFAGGGSISGISFHSMDSAGFILLNCTAI